MKDKNKVTASSNGTPPLSGAEFFARLIVSVINRNENNQIKFNEEEVENVDKKESD